MDLQIGDFEFSSIINSNYKIHIVGDVGSGKSTLIKDFIGFAADYKYFCYIITNKVHYDAFYSFYDTLYKYKRYSYLIEERLFADGIYLVLDDYNDIERYINRIYNKVKDKKMAIITASTTDLKNAYSDYIIITTLTDSSEIYNLYEKYIKKFMSLEQFELVIKMTTEDYECLVINCNTDNIDDLFLSVLPEKRDDLKFNIRH